MDKLKGTTMRRSLVAVGVTVIAFALTACGSDSEPVAVETTTTSAQPTTTIASNTTTGRPDLTDAQTDKVFLQVLESYNINYGASEAGGDAAAVNMGKTICDGLERGLSQTDILPALMDKGPGYNLTDATNYINTSIVAYCPDER
ncbi:hypothetical protein G9444_6725 (plasmid) [Rhodococcus erythropolis]|uniref:DUF732 domain-containing protein n=2 Tax=Rhodococcus erythropolis TaxID=1833 RepID=A0A6G9D482_RHOER|nr:hypothetical protein G9444_6725 [Rhodococcus erythropolis]